MEKTTLKVSKSISTDLLIVAKLNGINKEQLADDILKKGLAPMMESIKRERFA